MGTFASQLDVLNTACRDTFGDTEQILYQPRVSGVDVPGSPLQLTAIPIDPLRLEAKAAGQFTVRWVKTSDLTDLAITPAKGDLVTIPASANTIGGIYIVNQIQEDLGGGVRLILNLRSRS